jgi:fimbrial isopeptide formation D2 family protein/LPXTG-motif cell wall-anchored protein
VKKKGRISKLLSVVVSVAMALSCFSASAFADQGSQAAKETESNHSYALYQIFTGDVSSSGVFTNPAWGSSSTNPNNEDVDTVAKKIEALSGTDSEKLDTIKQYVDLTEAFKTDQPTKQSGGYEYTDLPSGYYLVKDTIGASGYYTLYVAKVTTGTLIFSPKGNAPYVDKEIVAANGEQKKDGVSVGDTVQFRVKGTVSDEILSFKEYFYQFVDTFPAGLDIVKTASEPNVKVYVKNETEEVEATDYFYVGYDDSDKKLTVSIQDLLRLRNTKISTDSENKFDIDGATEIIVEYSATLNSSASINSSEQNNVELTYYSDPNTSGSGTYADNPADKPGDIKPEPGEGIPTDKDSSQTDIYTTGLRILKTNVSNQALSGAGFTVVKKNGANSYSVVTLEETTDYIAYDDSDADAKENAASYTYYKQSDGTFAQTMPEGESAETAVKYMQKTVYKSTGYLSDSVKSISAKEMSDLSNDTDKVGDSKIIANVGGDNSNEKGVLYIEGLGAGTYYLIESVTPDNFNTMENKEFTIGYSLETGWSGTNIEYSPSDSLMHKTVENVAGSTLPETGGIGTTIFYVVGTILVLGAGVALVVRRRMRKETSQV